MLGRKKKYESPGEERFEAMLAQVKHLDRGEFNKTIEALKLAYDGYNKMLKVQTVEEKEVADIDKVERTTADYIETKAKKKEK